MQTPNLLDLVLRHLLHGSPGRAAVAALRLDAIERTGGVQVLGQRPVAEDVPVVPGAGEQWRLGSGRLQRHERPRRSQDRLSPRDELQQLRLSCGELTSQRLVEDPRGRIGLEPAVLDQTRTPRSRRSTGTPLWSQLDFLALTSGDRRGARGSHGENVHDPRQAGDGRLLEEVSHRDVDAEIGTQRADDPSGYQ